MQSYAGAVAWDVANFAYVPYYGYSLGARFPIGEEGVGVGVQVDVTTSAGQAILKNALGDYPLSYGILFLQVNENTLIDSDLFLNSSGSFFQTYAPSGEPISEKDVKISQYETVYLAFAMGSYDPHVGEIWSAWHGWISITYTGTGFDVASARVEMWPDGIYAGTGITVPEPSAVLLALSGFSLLLLRRRCRK